MMVVYSVTGLCDPYDRVCKECLWEVMLAPNLSASFSLRGKTNYINLGSFLIKPVQRVMRYPLLLMELLGATPESHHDRPQLAQALQAVKEINVNINEYKRRKDLGKKKKTLEI